jgi:hypothetical protein
VDVKVLAAGDGLEKTAVVALQTLDESVGNRAREEWALTKGFVVATPERVSHDIDDWRPAGDTVMVLEDILGKISVVLSTKLIGNCA